MACKNLKHALPAACAIVLWGFAIASQAKPYLPQFPNEVLEQLPYINNRTDRKLQDLQQQLNANPGNVVLASAIANRLIEIARSESDPRYYGYAEAAVKKWWHNPAPPPSVLMIRANLRQHRHDFSGALEDLQDVLTEEPHNAQAWLSQAVIQSVQGDYDASMRSCLWLKRLSTNLAATACMSNAASLSGSAKQAYAVLKETAAKATATGIETQLWTLTLLAEMANRLGDPKAAEFHYLQALALKQHDVYLLSSYSDFLLDQGHPKQVIDLLKEDTRPDGLLLRLALAEQADGLASLAQHRDEIQQRIASYRLRGENIHQREEARFYLELLHQPEEALKLALQNWQIQREPADTRLVLAAALASHNTEAAQPILAWLKEVKLEDKRLQQEVNKLEQR